MATKKKTPAKTVKDKGGRPTRFKTEYLAAIYKLCQLGATDADIAEAFGVTRRTVCGWKKKHPEVFSHIKRGKEDANENVKRALYHRAIGYSVKETKLAMFEGVFTDERVITKHYPPDTTACEIWLINRDPENWKSRNKEIANTENAAQQLADAFATIADKLPG
jgi:hypothetical protein